MSALDLSQKRSIYSPEPGVKRSPLAPHHSVMEALNMNDDEFTPKQLDFSTTSWQSIGDILGPRPTSSVLSSEETDDDGVNEQAVLVPAVANININIPSNTISNHTIDLKDDDRTIEIDMNVGFNKKAGSFFNPSDSAFVMPQMESSTSNVYYKILIIGNKKSNFFNLLDHELRTRFTLDVNDSYNIILIIFDGLVKIGNILNFIKQPDNCIQEKLFIPIFRNINLKIIEKILKLHKIELLCPPIHYDNKFQVQHLLEFLNDDLLSQRSIMSTSNIEYNNLYYLDEFDPAEELTSYSSDYQLVPTSKRQLGASKAYSNSVSSQDKLQKSIKIKHRMISKSSLEKSQASSSLISLESTTKSQLSTISRKDQSRESTRKKYVLMSISLTVGIGIGIVSAYTMSLFAKQSAPELRRLPAVPQPSATTLAADGVFIKVKQLSQITYNGVKITGSILKNNIIGFTEGIKDVSSFLWYEMKTAGKNLNCIWEYWIVGTGKIYSDKSLFWSF